MDGWMDLLDGWIWMDGWITESWGYVDIDVEVETGVFEETEATLPFFGAVAQFHQVAHAVRRRYRRRRRHHVLGAHIQPQVL